MNAVTAIACALALSTGSGAEEHLLAGAARFHENRYEEALVEFRVAEKLGAREAAAYAGATLVKLERWEDAIEAFGADGGETGGALIDYYRALAYRGARLYACADEILARVRVRGGPRLSDQAVKLRSKLALLLEAEPAQSAIQRHAARCAELERQGRPVVAQAYCREAKALDERRLKTDRGTRAAAGAASGERP